MVVLNRNTVVRYGVHIYNDVYNVWVLCGIVQGMGCGVGIKEIVYGRMVCGMGILRDCV